MNIFFYFIIATFFKNTSAENIIPLKNNWIRLESIKSLKINKPILVHNKFSGHGLIHEEIITLEDLKNQNWCNRLKGYQNNEYCKLSNSSSTTFIFHKKYNEGVLIQSVSFNSEYKTLSD